MHLTEIRNYMQIMNNIQKKEKFFTNKRHNKFGLFSVSYLHNFTHSLDFDSKILIKSSQVTTKTHKVHVIKKLLTKKKARAKLQ